MIGKEDALNFLKFARDVGRGHCLVDAHAHPFEVFGGRGVYLPVSSTPDVFSVDGSDYRFADVGSVEEESLAGSIRESPSDYRGRMLLLMRRRLYRHTGPRCFADAMTEAGVSKAVLLPVVAMEQDGEEQMEELLKIFGDDERFILGYPPSPRLPAEEIAPALHRAKRRYRIGVIKVHFNLSRIDPCSRRGRLWTEAVFDASRQCRLPVVLHAGPTPELPGDCADFARLEKLETLDFTLTDQPVVLAHAGAFGCSADEIETSIVPRLSRLLRRFENLRVDLSALPASGMERILQSVEPERILFGSDALYEQTWTAMVRLLSVLEKRGGEREGLLVRIASRNPLSVFVPDPAAESISDSALP